MPLTQDKFQQVGTGAINLPSSWKEAKASGSIHYFTGKECKHGHINKRLTSNGCCMDCANTKAKKHYFANADKKKAYNKEYVAKNKEYYKKKRRERYLANREEEKNSHKQWNKNNLGHILAYNKERAASKINATPVWTDKQYIEDIYNNTQEMKNIWKNIGIDLKLHVDHIVPLKNNKVCGLHNEFNLQVLTAEENLRKSNTFEVS